MFEKNNKKISPKKEYLSTSDLVVYLGLTLPEKREKLQEIISKKRYSVTSLGIPKHVQCL